MAKPAIYWVEKSVAFHRRFLYKLLPQMSALNAEIKRLRKLSDVKSQYIELLGKELGNAAAFLYVHGLRTGDDEISEGKRLREEIRDLEQPAAPS